MRICPRGLLALASLWGACAASPPVPSPDEGTVPFTPADAGSAQDAGPATNRSPDAAALDSSLADPGGSDGPEATPLPGVIEEAEPLAHLPHGEAQRKRLCARGVDNLVHDLFCGEAPPEVSSLADLQRALDIDPTRSSGSRGFALTAHSTALSARLVSALNPRAIFVRLEGSEEQEMLVLAFVRGERFVEAIVKDRETGALHFYIVAFRLPCDATATGCVPGDLFTPAAESAWGDLSIYDADDLANTSLDCRHCHQPDGPDTQPMLRMQELDSPWTHWFWDATEGGKALLTDYTTAKGDEAYAGIPAAKLRDSLPALLRALVRSRGDEAQPNVFPSYTVEQEVKASVAERGVLQPWDNSVPGVSPSWRVLYERARAGEAIPVPYHDVKVTDPAKFASAASAYQAYRAGTLSAERLPDMSDVFPDDSVQLSEMGFTTEPGLPAQQALVQACSQCHNARLDPTLSRARFDVDMSRVTPAVRELAVERLRLPARDARAMPPARIRTLSPEVREQLIEYLTPEP